jgi:hypothetical protein
MASICNDERARFGGMSGHDGLVHNLSEVPYGFLTGSNYPEPAFNPVLDN